MKISSRIALILMACLVWTLGACGAGPSTEDSPGLNPTETLPAQDAVTVTAAPTIEVPTSTAAMDDTLTEEQILDIVRSSLSAYPWRLEQTVTSKSSQQTTTSLTEAQSSTRGYNRSDQTLGSETITIESILIDQMLYLKITGSPAETYGLVSGEWAEVPPGSPLSQLSDTSAIDPAKIAEIFATDFASISGQNGIDEMVFTAVGNEDVDGVAATIYESKGAAFTYRWWVGGDGRFYKSTVDIPEATRTLLMEYDPDITVQAPVP